MGRPKSDPATVVVTRSAQFNPADDKFIREYAVREKLSFAAVVRQAVGLLRKKDARRSRYMKDCHNNANVIENNS